MKQLRNLQSWLLVFFLLLLLPAAAQEKKEAEETPDEDARTDLRIEVVGGKKEVPVDNASVYLRFPRDSKSVRSKLLELNLKTNAQGVTRYEIAPRGKVLIQVIAPGWKTFGRWYTLEKEKETIRIQLEEPPRWY
ncbi:MAG: hypothetical protein K6U09_11835 [Acidobacteriia bacterium]|jgi:hypothetical protein|nr:hypothetical protein [Terriglobia bacterium]